MRLRCRDVVEGMERAENRALFKTMGYTDEDLQKPLIGVANTWSTAVPGHYNLRQVADAVKDGIRIAGGTPVEFGLIGACDGIAEGHIGTRYILPTRELIADSVEAMAQANRFSGMVLLGSCERTLERGTDQNGNHLPMAKIAYLSMGMLLYCSNKLEEARRYLEEGIACYRELGFAHLAGLGEWYMVLLLYAMGEKEKAFEIAYRLKAYFKNFIAPQVAVFFEALEIELQLREGNVERAAQWLRESETVLDGVSGLQDINPYFTYIRTMIFQRNFRDAGAALEEKEALVRKEGRYWELITVLVLSALIEKNLGKEEEALSRIREALAIAAPEGYARSFLDEGNEVLELVRKVRDAAPEFVDKLTGEEAKKASEPTEPLKKREIEILGLIAKGMSNDEISEKLYITTGTTKWHIKNIFAKLGVKKRTQAVNKAKQLNIIG